MSQIVLRHGLDWNNLPVGQVKVMVSQDDLVERLARLRAEWTDATGGRLESVRVDLSSIFDDFEAIIKGERS